MELVGSPALPTWAIKVSTVTVVQRDTHAQSNLSGFSDVLLVRSSELDGDFPEPPLRGRLPQRPLVTTKTEICPRDTRRNLDRFNRLRLAHDVLQEILGMEALNSLDNMVVQLLKYMSQRERERDQVSNTYCCVNVPF